MGYSIFYPYRGMNVTIQGVPWLWLFPGVSILRYIVPGSKFSEFTFFGVADSKNFSGITFFQGIELSKIKFQGIYEPNNHSFQGVLVVKNLVVHTPVWIKNGIAHCFSGLQVAQIRLWWGYDFFYFIIITKLQLLKNFQG